MDIKHGEILSNGAEKFVFLQRFWDMIWGCGKSGGGWLVAAMTSNKHFNGASNRGDYFVGRAGHSCFTKTVAFEWPEVNCKAINLDITNTPSILSVRY